MKDKMDSATVLTDYEMKVWPQQEDCVVTYRAPDGYLCFQFYWKPNWWIRLWMRLGGFKAEWHSKGKK